MKFAQDVNNIPVYSTKLPHGDWPLWVFVGFIVGTFIIALSLAAYETSRGPNFGLRKVFASMIIVCLPVSMLFLVIGTSPSPAYDHYASYMADHQGRAGKNFDVKR